MRFFITFGILVSYTLFKALQMWPLHRYVVIGLLCPFFFLMIGWMFIYRSHPEFFNEGWFQAYTWVGSIFMGAWATFILFSMPFDIIHLALLIHKKFVATAPDPSRRAFLDQSARLALLGTSGVIAGLGLVEMFRGPRLKKTPITVASLPQNLKNLKIVQISDLHVGTTIRKPYVQDVVLRANAENPDLIFVTGDLADGDLEIMKEHLAPLKELTSKYGVFYVVGNHEYYWNVHNFIALAKDYGFTPLINENRVIEINGSKVLIAGVTDVVGEQFAPGHKPDLPKANQTDAQPQLKILLAHRPDIVIEADKFGYDLQFSGHTHAGQFFPFSILLPLVHKYYRGLNQVGKTQLYVNSGTGYWGPPNRFGISSEISSIELV